MSPADERERWNAKYAAGEKDERSADPLLRQAVAGMAPGLALDLAGGTGRHALWLAERGWQVTLSDISDNAMALARQRLAQQTGRLDGSVECRRETASGTIAWALTEKRCFHLIAVFWFLDRALFPALPRLLAPGGILVCKTFTAEHERFRGREIPEYALQPGELRTAFPLLDEHVYREVGGVAELVAQAR
ncbi:class I SAM-dependent methyltransferase [Paracidobacterium acidisoli]|nr:methyltransferase domain-containing protein [Paracidobacterium acidisoli]MBT9330467.1 methyltransferase domain-containing protein [Paracidobacterium acidisoli]